MSIVLGYESPGSRGESPLRSAVLGPVSHKLLHLSDRPVLCVPTA